MSENLNQFCLEYDIDLDGTPKTLATQCKNKFEGDQEGLKVTKADEVAGTACKRCVAVGAEQTAVAHSTVVLFGCILVRLCLLLQKYRHTDAML
jgi:hypothetical protein